MTVNRVVISQEIAAPVTTVFDWFYRSENYTKSPIVFQSAWRGQSRWTKGSQRDIIMIAGWYQEGITAVEAQRFIRYRVNKSFPPVRQDFTELSFREVGEGETWVTWTIELELALPLVGALLTRLGGAIAKILYRSILKAGKKELEDHEVK